MESRSYRVVGMSCDHCVRAVSEEISRIDGVVDVEIELASGVVTVTADRALDDLALRAAVDQAGYEVEG